MLIYSLKKAMDKVITEGNERLMPGPVMGLLILLIYLVLSRLIMNILNMQLNSQSRLLWLFYYLLWQVLAFTNVPVQGPLS